MVYGVPAGTISVKGARTGLPDCLLGSTLTLHPWAAAWAASEAKATAETEYFIVTVSWVLGFGWCL